MKRKSVSADEVLALRVALKRGAFVAVVSGLVALIGLALAREFLLMHMILLAAVSLSGGLACARAVLPVHPPSYRRAGNIGGMIAALVFVLPFIVVFSYLAAVMNAELSAELAAGLSAAEVTQLMRQNIQVGEDYFRGQYISYASGYLLFGLASGLVFGSLGAALARRQAADNTPQQKTKRKH
ncbi:MAG: hypothetical protein RMN25_12650 [Anaerolineae bacterium]|nr:hypothetical protein [Thermoflexales bacterium]MDW8408621.1 hypothetical protein [Anaerolineae bacterium]